MLGTGGSQNDIASSPIHHNTESGTQNYSVYSQVRRGCREPRRNPPNADGKQLDAIQTFGSPSSQPTEGPRRCRANAFLKKLGECNLQRQEGEGNRGNLFQGGNTDFSAIMLCIKIREKQETTKGLFIRSSAGDWKQGTVLFLWFPQGGGTCQSKDALRAGGSSSHRASKRAHLRPGTAVTTPCTQHA